MTRLGQAAHWCWLLAALALSAFWIWRSMGAAFGPDVIQDDARQHVFWMQRLVDPSLLKDDLFADYFASQAPPGYVVIFRLLLPLTDLVTASKLLPPILGLMASLFTFLLTVRLFPSGPAAFLATILGSWYVWQYDDLATGSPRAFLLPLTAMLLYALVAAWRWWMVVGVVALEAVLYPSAAALGVALVGVRLITVSGRMPRLVRDRGAWLAAVGSAAIALVVLAPTVLGGSDFGPAVSAQAARTMPEFGPGGRNAFFNPDPYQFWVVSYRSGFDLRVTDRLLPNVPIFYELLGLACLLPIAEIVRRRGTGKGAGPSLAPVAVLVLQVISASLLLFVAAHLLLFKLYLPARFVAWTLPLVLSIAAGVGAVALLTWLVACLKRSRPGVHVGAAALVLAGGLALYPAAFDGNFVTDRTPGVTAYLRSLPPETVVVGAPVEVDSAPAFSGRRVLTNREYALAYHTGFYGRVQERTGTAIDAYYAETPQQLAEVTSRYGIGVYLVNSAAYDPATVVDAWAGSFEPYTSMVLERVERGRRYALLDQVRRCGVLTEGDVTVVSAGCIAASR